MIAVNVVESSTPSVFDYFCYPDQNPGTLTYIQNQFQNISTTLMESGRQFLETSKNMFEKFYDSSVERAARAAVRMAKSLINPNMVQRFDDLEDIQGAGPLMQRYIMSDPYIREKYSRQLCSGYAGSYMDIDPNTYLNEHYDWRRVNQGMVRIEGEGENEEWVSTTFFEDLREGDRELTFDEKIDIAASIETARFYMGRGEDPTCPFGSKLG